MYKKNSQTERAEQKDALRAKFPVPAPWDLPPAPAIWQLGNTSLSLSKYKEEEKKSSNGFSARSH